MSAGELVTEAEVLAALTSPLFGSHILLVLSVHVRWCRERGYAVPVELPILRDFVTQVHSGGQEGTKVAEAAASGPRLLVKAEAAHRLGVSERTITRLVKAGKLPVVHIGRAVRFHPADIEHLCTRRAFKC